MKAKLIFHAGLKKYNNDLPEAMIVVPEGSTVGDLMRRLKVPMDQVAFVAVNGSRAPFSQPLADGDEVKLFQPVGGG
ncbi:MAG: MoaD/ThiS family protein [candidate division KSB1 bacterium]|nr:MoaD/ThiS family protein [candidate division KSB1 bacterium]MDZ7336601.1 MoaD/ThiS family protein [candidate division KSB1 bacterium]MDZ7399708.1 MoaD/ThiS family protein [candidate division KSB1 bacterium]